MGKVWRPVIGQADRENPDVLHITVDGLQVGDRLLPTNRTVIWVGQTVRTPGGKRAVTLRDSVGKEYTSYWWKATTVTVERKREGGSDGDGGGEATKG
jgi:hypothetical protein